MVAAGFVAFTPGAARAGVICQDFNGLDGGAAYAGGSNRSTACGFFANSNGDYSTAIGHSAGAIADHSVALGYLANAGGYYDPYGSPTINYNNAFTTALGDQAQAGASAVNQPNATAVGASAKANATNATALGASAVANYSNSIAIGVGATTTRDNQVVLGRDTNTYTLAGIHSQASTDAQSGPTYLVTTDAVGNLAASTFDLATLTNLPAQIAQNGIAITNLNNAVSNHTTQIAINTTELADHETRIANNTSQISSNTQELANHETRITNNTNELAVHTTQIADLDTRVTTNTTNITRIDGRVGALEAGFQGLGDQISENRTEARAGTALALATAGLRYDDRPEKLSLAGGFGHFKGQSGLALGLGYNTSEDFRLNAALSATTNHGDVGVSVGASWTLN
ncbi:YadA-like family protein [Mesorhizobium opportunistum]|uniref:YadA-like family protein n=1 Tax=Mesorhizobium opportunistum TaxID=593909 RepID=UPI0033392C1A